MWIIASLIGAWLLGSIPFSLIIGKKARGIDLREHGSGNLGATNVYRNLGAAWGAVCLLLDMAKGALAVVGMTLVVNSYPPDATLPLHLTGDVYRIFAAIVAILGHSFSPFVGFKGGKGIATTFGAFVILEPLPMAIVLGIFLAVFFATRIVSLGSICGAAIFPWATLYFELRPGGGRSSTLIVFSFILMILVIWRHRANIMRLQGGTESQLKSPEQQQLELAKAAADKTLHDIAPPEPQLHEQVSADEIDPTTEEDRT